MSPPPTRPEAFSPLSRRLVCVAGLAAILASQGCGSSAKHPNPQPNAERYVTGRIDAELQRATPTLRDAAGSDPDVFVFCRPAGGGSFTCNGSVTSSRSHQAIAIQRWRVEAGDSGDVTSARALDAHLVPQGAVAREIEKERVARRTGLPIPKPKPIARLSIAPAKQAFPPTRSYVCVDNGHGHILFQGVITAASKMLSFRAPHLRLNLGNSTVTMHVNGRIFRVASSPYGLDITPGRVSYLPRGNRPCNV